MKVSKCLLYLASAICLCGCSKPIENVTPTESEIVEVTHSYEEVADYELLWETMFDVDSVDYYVYIYSTTCNHCEELRNYIIEKAISQRNIYFVRGSSKDRIGNDPNKSKFAENPGDIWILGYPSMLKITEKKCLKNLAGINQIKGELK